MKTLSEILSSFTETLKDLDHFTARTEQGMDIVSDQIKELQEDLNIMSTEKARARKVRKNLSKLIG